MAAPTLGPWCVVVFDGTDGRGCKNWRVVWQGDRVEDAAVPIDRALAEGFDVRVWHIERRVLEKVEN